MGSNKIVWRKSSRSSSTGGECVELAALPGTVAVRDSKDPDGGKLVLEREAFGAFLAWLKQH